MQFFNLNGLRVGTMGMELENMTQSTDQLMTEVLNLVDCKPWQVKAEPWMWKQRSVQVCAKLCAGL